MMRLEILDTGMQPMPIFFKKIPTRVVQLDRPSWIPSHIHDKWDPNPYAYQTEQELMPAGGLHGQILTYFTEVVRNFLQQQGLMLLVDTFMLYRDISGIKKRIGPDLLLMADQKHLPCAYDLDVQRVPRCVIEITSPQTRYKDLVDNVDLYMNLGIESYFVIDAVTTRNQLCESVQLHLWRQTPEKSYRKVTPDGEGYLILTEMNLKIMAVGPRLIFVDAVTGEVLRDTEQLSQSLIAEARRADEAGKRVYVEMARADAVSERIKVVEEYAKCENVARCQAEQQIEIAAAEIIRLKKLLETRLIN